MRSLDDWQILIGRAASAITQREPSSEQLEGLLFFGNPHETVPRALLLDPHLGAVDILGWQMIRLMTSNDRTTAFPTYDQLQPLLRASLDTAASRGTVARVIAILRLTRWMSLCHKARHAGNGRVIGNIYALHDEPLSPDEAATLDPGYQDFVHRCLDHGNRAVQTVARQIYGEILQGGGQVSRLDQRARRFAEMRGLKKRPTPSQDGSKALRSTPESPEFAERTRQHSSENSVKTPSSQSEPRAVRDLSSQSELSEISAKSLISDLVRRENSACTVQERIYVNTSTGTGTGSELTRDLFWHPNLPITAADREELAGVLARLDRSTAQRVLDETAGRVAAGKARTPKGLLRSLFNSALKGEFKVTHYALAMQPPSAPGQPERSASPRDTRAPLVTQPPPARPEQAATTAPPPSTPRITHEQAMACRDEMLRRFRVKRR
ncbi:STY4528 family pathogenicity island replication protein [Azotobacter vinelandii]|uniref:STY4528 family pathogenicity island replication protein n=1 Tax=Azotobacter vinelandii TaxID=354 RepID=UPI000774A44D|nr:STY4528 family pathogenicity island replication protein [Azotobacter vinelandii]